MQNAGLALLYAIGLHSVRNPIKDLMQRTQIVPGRDPCLRHWTEILSCQLILGIRDAHDVYRGKESRQ